MATQPPTTARPCSEDVLDALIAASLHLAASESVLFLVQAGIRPAGRGGSAWVRLVWETPLRSTPRQRTPTRRGLSGHPSRPSREATRRAIHLKLSGPTSRVLLFAGRRLGQEVEVSDPSDDFFDAGDDDDAEHGQSTGGRGGTPWYAGRLASLSRVLNPRARLFWRRLPERLFARAAGRAQCKWHRAQRDGSDRRGDRAGRAGSSRALLWARRCVAVRRRPQKRATRRRTKKGGGVRAGRREASGRAPARTRVAWRDRDGSGRTNPPHPMRQMARQASSAVTAAVRSRRCKATGSSSTVAASSTGVHSSVGGHRRGTLRSGPLDRLRATTAHAVCTTG